MLLNLIQCLSIDMAMHRSRGWGDTPITNSPHAECTRAAPAP